VGNRSAKEALIGKGTKEITQASGEKEDEDSEHRD